MNLLEAKTYAQVNGIASVLLALVGFVAPSVFGLFTMELGHTIVHILIAVIALYFGFGPASADATHNFAKIFGVIYLLLGVAGFVSGNLWGLGDLLWGLHLELWENVLHVVLGAWGAWIGFRND